ncbi:hypothetical protein ACIQ9P_03725 [Kitasatospora sp. NPDC094019]|uniref:hypothetical protein n=1 Tax=Kitasatospora sp. NPDC094019 TaxID=3364091 RepID=UPI003813746F
MTLHLVIEITDSVGTTDDDSRSVSALGLLSLRTQMRRLGMLADYQPLLWPDLDGERPLPLPGGDGIPDSKLTSTSGQLITPAEIAAALAAYDRTPDTVRADLEADWSAWAQ